MEQGNYNTNTRKNKHILEKDRITIEQMLNAGCKRRENARVIGCSERTLRREILRGTWARLNSDDTISHVYSFDVAQRKHEEAAKNKGPYAKLANDPEQRKHLR